MRFATLLRPLAALFVLATPAPAQAPDTVAAMVRVRVDSLLAGATATVQGVPLLTLDVLAGFYAQRGFRPAWTEPARLAALLQAIRASEEDGLTPADYLQQPLERLGPAASAPRASAALHAEVDLLATEALIRLASSLRFGKVDPAAADGSWNFPAPSRLARWGPLLDSLVASDTLAAALAALAPRHPFYLQLRAELARYRSIDSAGGWTTIVPGPLLTVGMKDPRVPALRSRLSATGDLPPSAAVVPGERYDRTLAAGLERFQARLGLAPDGVLGPRTVGELNVPPILRIKTLRVNLERGRWILPGLGTTFVAVNIPAFQAYYLRNDSLIWSGRAVVGQPYLQTPEFRARMTYLILNPTWTVPPKILTDEVLPDIRKNPAYLARNNMLVLDREGAPVDPAGIDWNRYDDGRTLPYRIVQQPGGANPLGRIKFNFPNAFSVYLHDTPTPALFRNPRRTFSHGCIRIQSPMPLASQLLGDSTWTPAALDSAAALGQEMTLPLPTPVTVLILYWTAWTDPTGALNFRPDVYGRDSAIITALDGPFTFSPRGAAPTDRARP